MVRNKIVYTDAEHALEYMKKMVESYFSTGELDEKYDGVILGFPVIKSTILPPEMLNVIKDNYITLYIDPMFSISPTSENSADVHIYACCFLNIKDIDSFRVIDIETSMSIEIDAETGDSRIVVGEITWPEKWYEYTPLTDWDFYDAVQRSLGFTRLNINYFNYDKPNVKVKPGAELVQAIENAAEGGCFIAGTQITMADGSTKNVEDVQIGDYIQDANGKPQKVVWNQPLNHKKADHYIEYVLPNGKTIGIVGDDRLYWCGKFRYISEIPGLKSKRIDEECYPYEIYTTGQDAVIANGMLFGKSYSNIKFAPVRWIVRQLYKLCFLHEKDYKFSHAIHEFIRKHIIKHNIP